MRPEIPGLLRQIEERLLTGIVSYHKITCKAEPTKPWESKIGGCPYLRREEDYPMGENDRPLLFFAQINLTDLDGEDALPQKGLLQFFVENNGEYYGTPGGGYVRYLPEYSEDESGLLISHPYGKDKGYADLLPYTREARMYFSKEEMFLSTSLEDAFDELCEGLNEEQVDALRDLCYADGSRVGGYPYFVQHDAGFDPQNDYLLLQLDCDDESGLMFGDAGNCNFWISRRDLSKLDFSHVNYDWQCC